jgi:hypothetical protein
MKRKRMRVSLSFAGAIVVALLAGAVYRFAPFAETPAATLEPVVDERVSCEERLEHCREMRDFLDPSTYRTCLRRLATPLLDDPAAWSFCGATAFRMMVDNIHASVTSVTQADEERFRDAGAAYLAVVLGAGLAQCVEKGMGSCVGKNVVSCLARSDLVRGDVG